MLKRCITSQAGQKPIEAAAPNQGAAAFFYSTEILPLGTNLWCFPIFQQQAQGGKPIAFYNLLPEKHYFRLNRAETPFADVVLTEGQKRRPSIIQEVAA